MSKRGIIQLSEFDINQKIIESLSNVCTRSVLFSVKNESKDVTQIANELKIPLSSVYKKLSDLEELTLIKVEEWMISDKGRKYKVYRSRIKQAEISIKKPEPVLILVSN